MFGELSVELIFNRRNIWRNCVNNVVSPNVSPFGHLQFHTQWH